MQVRWLLPLASAPIVHVACAAQYMTIEQAQHAAFPGASEFQPITLDSAATAALGNSLSTPKVWRARADVNALGWLLVDQVIGKSELITYALALDRGGAVRSIEVLDYRESHGGEIRLEGWRKQFVGKTAADPVELNQDIKNISGATLSCRHVTDGVRRLLKVYKAALSAMEHD